MGDANEMKLQEADNKQAAPVTKEEKSRAARRRFLRQALALTPSLALVKLFPSSLVGAAAQSSCGTQGPDFIDVKPITSVGRRLQAVMKVTNGNRIVPGRTDQPMLRYFAGYNPNNLTTPVWPTTSNAGPGPTLRCEIGDSVEITLINQVKVEQFLGSLYT